jgi:signal transduction histidine kinase
MRRPAPTVRLRLTLLYGVTFLLTGAVLLTIGYVLVRHNLDGSPFRRRFGAPPLGLLRRPAGGVRPTDRELALVKAVHDQLVSASLHRLVLEYGLALVAMTLVSGAAGWLLAGRALAPLRRITAAARRVSGENLGERIDLTGPADELKELADTFDGMLGRLDRAFSSQRHFVASASHELRTPLAIMRTEIDVALADDAAGTGELRAMGEALRETIDRCERLIEGLLMLARSEASTGVAQPVDLAGLAADCVTDDSARAREAGITVTTELHPAPTRGEPALLERTIANLVENGIRHNQPGGRLHVQTDSVDGVARVLVRSAGERIDPAQVAGLTEPFRRLDPSREGFGLGLSIVRSVVEAHGGVLRLEALSAGGLEVEVRLPGAQRPPAGSLRGADGAVVTTISS